MYFARSRLTFYNYFDLNLVQKFVHSKIFFKNLMENYSLAEDIWFRYE